MRSTIVEALNNHFDTEIFTRLIPHGHLMYALAFSIVLIIFVNRSSGIGLSKPHAFWSGIWAIAVGLIGSRVYYLLQNLDAVMRTPSLILTGGTGSWGGYIGGTIGFMLCLKMYHVRVLEHMDVAASTLGLGIFIARWSCFLKGCCFGNVSSLPWAVRYPRGSLPFNAQAVKGLITPESQLSLPVHPVQVYSALNGLLLFLLASWYWKRLRERPGATFCIFWLSWCMTRFGLEFLRGDTERGFVGPLSTPQFICVLLIPLLLFGVWWFVIFRMSQS